MAKNNDIHKEMEQLRNQVNALKQAQQESADETVQQDDSAQAETLDISTITAGSTAGIDTESEDELDLASQLQELMDVLDKEIKDTNPATLLVVVSHCLLVGRLLPR